MERVNDSMYGSLRSAYSSGYALGQFLGGALIGGLIPAIIFFVKKRWKLGFSSLITCGAVGYVFPIGALIAGVIFLIAAIKAERVLISSASFKSRLPTARPSNQGGFPI